MDTIRRKYGERSVTRGRLVRAGVSDRVRARPELGHRGADRRPGRADGAAPEETPVPEEPTTRASIRPAVDEP